MEMLAGAAAAASALQMPRIKACMEKLNGLFVPIDGHAG
ncbi:hypothetical protein CCACVL1_17074 [Corchorus capsularis]|uniref:Uncharacterized protein n=1 Tax=Corchorus capsularis TaxID=210143 RepID=A0A1R3HUQ7_COCAP|nr:hypothetical protein CCACVL1_17074 [Corchorus capsularis]